MLSNTRNLFNAQGTAMPPVEKFSREKVISAAFELVRKHGMGKLSARSVAHRLGSSTAPVYNHFSSMPELKAFRQNPSRMAIARPNPAGSQVCPSRLLA